MTCERMTLLHVPDRSKRQRISATLQRARVVVTADILAAAGESLEPRGLITNRFGDNGMFGIRCTSSHLLTPLNLQIERPPTHDSYRHKKLVINESKNNCRIYILCFNLS